MILCCSNRRGTTLNPVTSKKVKWSATQFTGSILIFLTLIVCILYYDVSTALNAQPNTKPFNGWATLLQPLDQLDTDSQIRISATPLDAKTRTFEYSVSVCGSKSFEGLLLLGEDARLFNLQIDKGTEDQITVRHFRDMTFQTPTDPVRITNLDALSILIASPAECLSPRDSDDAFVGTGIALQGRLNNSFLRGVRVGGLFTSPRTVQALPLIGAFPGTPLSVKGAFTGTGSLTGPFRIPAMFIAVDGGDPELRLTVEQSRPATSTDALAWRGNKGVQATTLLLDSQSSFRLQQMLTLLSIAIGIFGSVVASMVYESWHRTRVTDRRPVSDPAVTPHASSEKRRGGTLAFAILVALLIPRFRRRD